MKNEITWKKKSTKFWILRVLTANIINLQADVPLSPPRSSKVCFSLSVMCVCLCMKKEGGGEGIQLWRPDGLCYCFISTTVSCLCSLREKVVFTKPSVSSLSGPGRVDVYASLDVHLPAPYRLFCLLLSLRFFHFIFFFLLFCFITSLCPLMIKILSFSGFCFSLFICSISVGLVLFWVSF